MTAFVLLPFGWLGGAGLAPAVAAAQEGNPLVEEGAALYEALRFEEALQVLSAALIRAGNSEEERATTLRLLAFTYLALGRTAEADGAHRQLLALRPDFEVGSDVSPRFRAFFAESRERWASEERPVVAARGPVEIAHVSPAQTERALAVPLEARVEDPESRVEGVVLAYRQGTRDVFRRLDTELREGVYRAEIPADDVRPPLVEYYFEALGEGGLPIAARGDIAAPLRIAVQGDAGGGVVTKWWFWTAAALLVGGAVTTAVLLTRDGGGPGQGTLIVDAVDMP